MINTKDNLWKCDGCNGMFARTEIVDSIHEPYYACHACENNLLKNMEERERMEEKND